MDAPSTNTVNSSVPRQRSSPANDRSPSPSPISIQQTQPYPYPVQQQQAGWNAQAQQFYPSFYQNPHQQPYPMHPHSPQGQVHQQAPYFDPNAQFAQWAYQQMMFNAQQQALSHAPQASSPLSGRGRSSSTSSPGEYFPQNPMQGFNPFPSGTPPPHPNQLPQSYRGNPPAQQAYDSFHPYRRPNQRQGSYTAEPPPPNGGHDWRGQGTFQPPYARTDAAGSSTSVNSSSSHSGGSRQRTSSLQSSSAGNSGNGGGMRGRNAPAPVHISSGSSARGGGSSSPTTSTPNAPRPHHRNPSSSSSSSASPASRPPSGNSAPSGSSVPVPRPVRPSPLSQGNITAADKRKSRDDSDLDAMMEPIPSQNMLRSGGLKGRLRRALSLSAAQAMHEEESDDGSSRGGSRSNGSTPSGLASSPGPSSLSSAADPNDAASTATRQTKKKSRTALFSSRLNASTDNISLSSTMSSASVVIRKLGSIGKLARRNSIAGITSLFKDKKDKEDAENSKKGKKKKGGKGEAAQASISHVTAELDRSSSEWNAELNGLSPAAKLARQHTLKSNAE
ncbi:hypothetical protein EW146_g9589, partial [Bondarzewia mesenterica]